MHLSRQKVENTNLNPCTSNKPRKQFTNHSSNNNKQMCTPPTEVLF